MKKYRVEARSVSYVYVDVEAESPEEALAIAEDIDGGDFTDTGEGDWDMTINDVYETE